MRNRKFAVGLTGIAVTSFIASLLPVCHAADETQPQINASGKGMTNAQLEATRPVLSGLKSITEIQQSLNEIQDKAKAMLEVCTMPCQTGSDSEIVSSTAVISGPYSHTNGKYFLAPQWKLLEINKTIDKQREFLAESLNQNQHDQRTLRASEATRQKVESLRADARELTKQMILDANQLTTLISTKPLNQSEVANTAKALMRSSKAVGNKLKDMEKVLQKEQKSS